MPKASATSSSSCDSVTRLAGVLAVGMHEAAPAYRIGSEDLHGAVYRTGHGQVVARTGGGDGFLEAVGGDEDVRHGAMDVGTQFQRQFIVHQQHELARLGQGEAAVLTEGAAGPAEVQLIPTFDQAQTLLGGQGAHGAVALDAFLSDGRFTAADQGYPGAAA